MGRVPGPIDRRHQLNDLLGSDPADFDQILRFWRARGKGGWWGGDEVIEPLGFATKPSSRQRPVRQSLQALVEDGVHGSMLQAKQTR